MAGTIRRRGSTYEIVYWVGFQPCQRCQGCNRREWVTQGRLSRCPHCGGNLQDFVERRQQFQGGFRTKRDAQRELNAALAALDSGAYVQATRVSVADYLLANWLLARKPKDGAGRGHRGQLGIGTWNDYKGIISSYVVPRLGVKQLQDLRASDLSSLYDELEESGGQGGGRLSAKTVLNVHRLLHKALADAVRQGLITRNPAALVHAPSARKPQTEIWDVEQLRAFLRQVQPDQYFACWLLFATTGMRRGEVAGLAWADLDLERSKVRIVKTLGLVNGRATWKPRPKSNAGERTMSLDPATVDALKTHRRNQAEARLLAGPGWQERQPDWRGNYRDDLVFTRADGTLISPDRWTRWFQDHRKAAGLPPIRLHDLRHTYATAGLSAAKGWHEVKVISERLGHATVGFTIDTYAHVLPVADEETAQTLARVILGT